MNTIILAGGQSSRMGQNKALMRIGGARVIDRIAEEFEPVSQKIIIVASDPEPYENIKADIIQDDPKYRGQGPLAGMYTGLKEVYDRPCLIVACDMPFASANLGSELIAALEKEGCDAVIPVQEEQMHPLFGVYHSRIAGIIQETLEQGNRSVRALLDRIQTRYYTINEESDAVWNMNTKEDYIKAVGIAEGRGKDEL